MSDTSGYDDDVVTIPVASPSVDRAAAQGYLSQHRARGDKATAQFDEIMRQRAAAVDAARAQLDDTITKMRSKHEGAGLGQVNLPLLSLAAGLLSPGPPGTVSNFGSELGRGLSAMGTTIRAQRMSDTEFQRGIGELQQKSAQLADKPLADQAAIAGRRETTAEQAAAGIEKALIKADVGGAGATPAKIKEFNEWAKTNPGKSYEDFLVWYAKNVKNDKKPASLQEFDVWLESNPGKSFGDFVTEKAKGQAAGRETGKSQAEVAQTLPGMDANIDQMAANIETLKKHPGLPKAVGLLSPLTTIPGGDAADFEAALDQLKGQAFLVQFDKLRGAGAITESEGKKATDALAALSTRQSQGQFKKQLDVVLDILKRGREVARQKAGVAKPVAEAAPPVEGARKAADGKWYIEKGGKFFEVRP